MKWTLYLVAAALAGCAVTPAEIQERGERMEYRVAGAPEAAAACMARNATEALRGAGSPRAQRGEQPGVHELVIHSIAYAQVRPAVNGSTVTMWFARPTVLDTKEIGGKIVGGC